MHGLNLVDQMRLGIALEFSWPTGRHRPEVELMQAGRGHANSNYNSHGSPLITELAAAYTAATSEPVKFSGGG